MNESNMESSTPVRSGPATSAWAIPAAIVIGFGLIAAAIYLSGSQTAANQPVTGTNDTGNQTGDLSAVAPISVDDHIRGNPNAPLVIVEYADFECPYCRNFHTTLQKIVDEYGPSGKVAWVYRHFPLVSLHPSAEHIAEASECVAEQGGNDAFWKFADLVFGERGVNEFTDLTRLPEFAASAGVDKTKFQECLDSGRMKDKVTADYNNAVQSGGQGTPFSVIVAGDQKFEITGGAQPYEVVKQMVDGMLQQ